MKEPALYFQYWGKTDRQDSARYHLLPYHCLDVAAVASVWWDQSQTIRRSFCRTARTNEKFVKAWMLFFVALHDYGKFDIRFQRKADAVRHVLLPLDQGERLPKLYASTQYDHGSAGLYWFSRDHLRHFQRDAETSVRGLDLFGGDSEFNDDWQAWRAWLEPVCGHHGFIQRDDAVKDWRISSEVSRKIAESDSRARLSWVAELESLFLNPCGLGVDDKPPQPSPLLAGFCSVADWLGSRSDEENFVLCAHPQSLETYFTEKLDQDARRVLDLSGMIGKSKPYRGLKPLLPNHATPRGLQCIVDELPAESGLTIVEAPTGSGKTEMAIAYAWRLIGKGLAESIVLALPTQATANKMFDRLEALSTQLFETSPNLLLAHGNARFNERFISVKNSAPAVKAEDEAWAQCCEWLSQSRKRVFLGQIGVSTVDQVLVAVLPVRHRFIRGFGAGRSILIIDEVHAYDAYMYGLMQQVLKEQRAAGGSVILLSATLPLHQRQALVAAWDMKLPPEGRWDDYPLVTWAGESMINDIHLPRSEQSKNNSRPVNIIVSRTEEMLPDEDLLSEMIQAAAEGAQVATICNLVDHAQLIYEKLKQSTDLPVILFHARFTLKDRMAIEKRIDQYFGKQGDRSVGRILLGTQVLEMSLDYDVDWMVTQLCPVDALFQRLGRLHRHQSTCRPQGYGSPRCTILTTDRDGFDDHSYVYNNTLVMWRTHQLVSAVTKSSIDFPSAYRVWIERIYDRECSGNEPGWVIDGNEKYLDELERKKSTARQMIKWAEDTPLADNDENIQAVTRDGETNLLLVPFVKTPYGKQLIDGSVVEQLPDFSVAEAITMNSVSVPRSWEYWIKPIEIDDVLWLPMNKIDDKWMAQLKKGKVEYTASSGMRRMQ